MTTTISNLDKLIAMSSLAYQAGLEQKTKGNLPKEELFNRVCAFNVRKGYMPMVWEAYKAGRFAAKHGDQ